MKTTVRELRRWITEALRERRRDIDDENALGGSILGVKNKDVTVSAGSRLAKRLEPEIFDMINKSYEKVGGNAKIKSPEDIGDEYPDWIVADIDDDPDPDVFIAGSPRSGAMKLGAIATDGSTAAKNHMMTLKKKLYSNGWWAEVSGSPAHIALNKLRVKPVEDEKKVRELLGDKEITWHGEHPEGKFPGTYGWYTRSIGGTSHAKIIVGDVLGPASTCRGTSGSVTLTSICRCYRS